MATQDRSMGMFTVQQTIGDALCCMCGWQTCVLNAYSPKWTSHKAGPGRVCMDRASFKDDQGETAGVEGGYKCSGFGTSLCS